MTFKSHIDGSMHRFTPEKLHRHPGKPGRGYHHGLRRMAPPYDRDDIAAAPWSAPTPGPNAARRHTRGPTRRCSASSRAASSPTCARESAKFAGRAGFPRLCHRRAVGGRNQRQKCTPCSKWSMPLLPENKPRYLMGVGSPEDLVNGVLRGMDIFDCVLPTRLARHQAAMTRTGRLNLMNAAFSRVTRSRSKRAATAIPASNFTRAYLRHLIHRQRDARSHPDLDPQPAHAGAIDGRHARGHPRRTAATGLPKNSS